MKRMISMVLACALVIGTTGCQGTASPSAGENTAVQNREAGKALEAGTAGEAAGNETTEAGEAAGSETAAAGDTGTEAGGSGETGQAAQETVSWIPEEETESEPAPSSEYNVISVDDYIDKTTSGLLGQFVGFLSGYEFVYDSDGTPRTALPEEWFEICNGPYADPNPHNKHQDKLLMNDETGLWEVWNDDDYSIDILDQYILADAFERYGTFSSKMIKDGWVNYDVYDMGGGNRSNGAYALMKNNDYLPVFSGSAEFGNIYTVYGEPYIGNETLGMSAAGMPNLAVDLAAVFGGVTSDRDPALWLKYFAAMYAMAYFEDDVPTLLREAEIVLPEGCWQRKVVDEIFAIKEQYPDDWRRAVVNAERNCYLSHCDLNGDVMGETSVNCAFIVLGLLYGDGDYYETCKIMSLAGHGGDSTTPTGLSIVGIINGMKFLDDERNAPVNEKIWQDGQGVVINKGYPDSLAKYYMYCPGLPEIMPMTELVDLYRQNFEHLLLENGGRIEDGNYYIPKDPLRGAECVFAEDFESGNLDGWEVIGGTELSDPGFTGTYSARVNGSGSDTEETGLYTTLSGLVPGAKYRMTAYVRSTAKTSARLFAREPGAEEYTFATAEDQQAYAKRDFVFRATAETMEIGILVPAGTNERRNARIDDITVVHILEAEPLGDCVAITSAQENGMYTGQLELTITGSAAKEVYLKLTFANPNGRIVNAPMTVGEEHYAAIPFYKTGDEVYENSRDCVYIPVILENDVNTVTLDLGNAQMYIPSAQIVTVSDRRQ